MSHSSRDVDLTNAVKTSLQAEDNFELLLDTERLKPGWEWEPFIHEWLARCDAGLLLLTPDAVVSNYVLKEATILAWRMSLDPDFQFFVARDPGSVEDQLIVQHGFSPIRLDRIQQIHTLEACEIGDHVRAGLASLAPKNTPFDKLVGTLADLLAGSGRQAISDIASNLGVIQEWSPSNDETIRHVESIARHLLCGELGKYGIDAEDTVPGQPHGLNALIGDLVDTTSPKRLRTILRILAPHWVDGDAAGKLALLPVHQERRAVGLNGKHVQKYTAPMFLERGHLNEAAKYGYLHVAGGNASGFVEHYITQICDAYVQAGMGMFEDETEDVIIDAIKNDPTRYVVIPPPVPPESELIRLFELFPTINFVLSTGESLEKNAGMNCVDWADPPIDPDIEQRTYQDMSHALRTIKENADRT